MSDAPKWIADELGNLPSAVGPIERESIAIAIAEAFPLRECMSAAQGSLRSQLATAGVTLGEREMDAIANNMIQAIAGVVMGIDTENGHAIEEYIEMYLLLGSIGAPYKHDGKRLRIAERLQLLINHRRGKVGA